MSIANQDQELIEAARQVREMAYAPFSGYRVGAAIRTTAQEIFTGCNVENASYGLSICAERAAIAKMISEAKVREIDSVAIVTKDGGSPCGACRQVLFEFGDNYSVISFSENTGRFKQWRINDLLPDGFRLES